MTTTETTAAAEGLTAIETTDGWAVSDIDGGRWWPSDEAAEEIAASADPAACAVRIADAEPMRGTWHS